MCVRYSTVYELSVCVIGFQIGFSPPMAYFCKHKHSSIFTLSHLSSHYVMSFSLCLSRYLTLWFSVCLSLYFSFFSSLSYRHPSALMNMVLVNQCCWSGSHMEVLIIWLWVKVPDIWRGDVFHPFFFLSSLCPLCGGHDLPVTDPTVISMALSRGRRGNTADPSPLCVLLLCPSTPALSHVA